MIDFSTCRFRTYNQQQNNTNIIKNQFKFSNQTNITPLKGLTGLIKAHQILIEQNYTGILIGNLAQSLWNHTRTENELNQHKDVDVLILNKNIQLTQRFQGGIDWWILKQYTEKSNNQMHNHYTNGNGMVLEYTIQTNKPLSPGLHIPTPQTIHTINKIVENSKQKQENIGIKYIRNKHPIPKREMTNSLPKFIPQQFFSETTTNPFKITKLELEIIKTIKEQIKKRIEKNNN